MRTIEEVLGQLMYCNTHPLDCRYEELEAKKREILRAFALEIVDRFENKLQINETSPGVLYTQRLISETIDAVKEEIER